jgi:hypothetical protein
MEAIGYTNSLNVNGFPLGGKHKSLIVLWCDGKDENAMLDKTHVY